MSTIQNSNMRQMDPDLGSRLDQFSMREPQVRGAGITGPGTTQSSEAKGGNFLEALEKSMSEVNADQISADTSIKDLVAGKTKNIHETMLQIQKADLSLKTMMQVRNKILEAYKEIIRMQV